MSSCFCTNKSYKCDKCYSNVKIVSIEGTFKEKLTLSILEKVLKLARKNKHKMSELKLKKDMLICTCTDTNCMCSIIVENIKGDLNILGSALKHKHANYKQVNEKDPTSKNCSVKNVFGKFRQYNYKNTEIKIFNKSEEKGELNANNNGSIS